MDKAFYTEQFEAAVRGLDRKVLKQKQLETAVGRYGADVVVLKVFKRAWSNQGQGLLTIEARIFFSVWMSERDMEDQRLWYNIHAFKLRHLKGYAIQSRKFADVFRSRFKPEKQCWPNVSIAFGPQMLMEGWLATNSNAIRNDILGLARTFIDMVEMIDETLAGFKV